MLSAFTPPHPFVSDVAEEQPHAFALWGLRAFALPMWSRDVDAQRFHASTSICK